MFNLFAILIMIVLTLSISLKITTDYFKGKVVDYTMQEDLMITGHVACGYLRLPHWHKEKYIGKCALTQDDCKYPHSNYEGCKEYTKRYNK